jgi:hypothetical protein
MEALLYPEKGLSGSSLIDQVRITQHLGESGKLAGNCQNFAEL